MSASEFCRYCGAGVGALRRIGEGTCQECDPVVPRAIDAARWRYARANGLIYAISSFPLRGTTATPGRVGDEAADAFVDQQMMLGNGRTLDPL